MNSAKLVAVSATLVVFSVGGYAQQNLCLTASKVWAQRVDRRTRSRVEEANAYMQTDAFAANPAGVEI